MKLKKNRTPLIMALVLFISIIATLTGIYFYRKSPNVWLEYSVLLFGEIALQFLIMHIAAPVVVIISGKKFRCDSFWFRPKKFEKRLYEKMQVKKWKTNTAVYNENEFSLQKHTPEELIMNMCSAEVVHEVIAVAGFLPVLFSFYIGHFRFLFLFSFVCGCAHMVFVVIQRYNRPRVVKLYEMKKIKHS